MTTIEILDQQKERMEANLIFLQSHPLAEPFQTMNLWETEAALYRIRVELEYLQRKIT